MNVMGVSMNADVRGWDGAQRRVGSLLALGATVLLVLIGVATYVFARDAADLVSWILVALLVLVLVYQVLVLALGARAASAPAPTAPEHEGEGGEPRLGPGADAPYTPPTGEPETLTLRCGDCGTIFDVNDTGERPLYHSCPGCGAQGVLREPPAAPASAPEPELEPPAHAAPSWQQPEERHEHAPREEPAPAVAPAEAPPVKRVKLRCGGCKQVFAIDDTGERPLKTTCAHCGRGGQIK